MTVSLKRLRELEEKATPGPWTWVHFSDPDREPIVISQTKEVDGVPVEVMGFGFGAQYDQCPGEAPSLDDQALIAEMRNALPALLRVVELARQVVAESDAELMKMPVFKYGLYETVGAYAELRAALKEIEP